jgi:hypothetical protein
MSKMLQIKVDTVIAIAFVLGFMFPFSCILLYEQGLRFCTDCLYKKMSVNGNFMSIHKEPTCGFYLEQSEWKERELKLEDKRGKK